VLACISGAANADAASNAPACTREVSATTITDGIPDTIRARVDRSVRQASVLARFERSEEAVAKLDALIALLGGPRGERVEKRAHSELTNSIRALKHCLAARSNTSALTWVTIAVFDEPNTPEGGRGEPAGAGVFLDVEGIPIGRSGPDGTLEVKVPSGTFEIHATKYPSSWGAETVTVSAGESRTVSIVMAGDKEPSEESDLVLEEAPQDILPANLTSITLKFAQDDDPVRIESIDSIELSDTRGSGGDNLEQFFSVTDGAMRATDVPALSKLLVQQSQNGRALWIMASGIDAQGRRHYGDVQFQMGKFKLTVTLAPPPSNPALPVSNVTVRVSVVGGDAALTRVSDASGRFEIESLPDATINIDAHAIASANHYYADATVALCGDTSATVLLRNVKDIVAGIRSVIVDSGMSACGPLPRLREQR
jgi:hypothetical protein